MKKVFKIDCGLYPLGIFTVLTGVSLHIAGHGVSHNIWEIWAVLHSLVAVAFTVLLANHILTHRAWFKNMRRSTFWHKRIVTTTLSVLLVLTALSGVVLLAVWGTNTHLGLLHYKIGLGFALLMVVHGAKRVAILRNAVISGKR